VLFTLQTVAMVVQQGHFHLTMSAENVPKTAAPVILKQGVTCARLDSMAKHVLWPVPNIATGVRRHQARACLV
jgi:hypothetical protein